MRIVSIGCMAIVLALNGCASTRQKGVPREAVKNASVAKAGLVHIPVRENGVIGTLVVPDSKRAYPGVLRIGGGEGGISVGDAETIASEGYAVFAIAYFGMEGLPADLEEVPLEYFGKAIAWMKGSPNIDSGKAIPYVPYDFSNEAALVGCDAETAACAKMYEHSLKQYDRVQDALIPVEQIHAPVLLLSGKADSMWPSSAMGNLIMQRLEQRSFPYEHRHIAYENAGHCGINRCYDHVPLAGDQAAVDDMRRQLIQFLDRHLLSKQDASP